MTIRSILAHVDYENLSKASLAAAVSLADSFDAHITGIANKTPIYIPAYATAEVPAEVFIAYDEERNRMLEQAREEFEAAVKTASRLDRSAWQIGKGDLSTAISTAALFHDLVVMRQENSELDSALYEGVPGNVIINSPCPVLIIPYIDRGEKFGKSILIGWSDTRESARAVRDALPFLKRAEKVEIFSANSKENEDVPGAELARYLSEHGITSKVSKTSSSDVDIGDMLLNDVVENGHDMIVMGGYGHLRLREMIMGGVTRQILKHMTVPVLFSH